MPKLTIYDRKGKKVGTYNVEPTDFAPRISKQLLHDAVVMYQANVRQGSHQTKSRGMVSGSTKKMYRQKGTGNARAGSKRSGIRRGGGHIHHLIRAANRIASAPYRYGGGHGSYHDSGYDCSGSVSYALHYAGLLRTPLDSSGLMSYGAPGRGRYITIYANPGHAYMVVDGRRFDTSAIRETGSRWTSTHRSSSGYVVRHPPGL